ncbi:FxSxx-COOH system tetratricopeptide repeat protein [Streptomyces sp. NBC_01615]|uniref:FxSxx-COOH system tetratricopeptide repeat protein n=1 Tax=Streptomyces sp. NBC_01615 TaxID=2975898 RepID=UPI00386BD24F
MDVQRVMEVWDPAGQIAGTGYLITDNLVLTAYHNIQRAGSTTQRSVEVRRLGLHGEQHAEWMAAEMLWPEQPPDIEQDPHADAALLLITDSAWQPSVAAAPVRWGRLAAPSPGAVGARVACIAVGFPEAEQRDGKRDTKQISGHIETLSGLKSGLITSHIDHVATPSAAGAPSSWSGASGAALFCGNLLTGVLTTDRARNYPGNQLIAVPLATLAARPGFTTTIKAAGNPLTLEDITTSAAGDSPPSGPYDADIPMGLHNLPGLPAEVFVGREEALTTLAAAMEQGSKAITQTVQGLGGVGKTTLALHYAHAHRDSYRLVWWIHADTPEQITTDLAGLTNRIKGAATGGTSVEDAEWAIGWLQTHPGWLLILDNAEHPDTTRHLTGQLHHAGRHLITSRFAHGWPTAPLALPLLTPAASFDLLTQLTGLTDADNQHHARLLADDLGHLPLALEQAGAFIAQSRISVSDYRDLFRQHPAQTTSTAPAGSDPQRTMARIWRITLDALHRTTPLAVDILGTAAWYAPNDIPRPLLAPLTDDPVSYAQALSQLAAYNMITLGTDTFGTHRLIQTVARTPDSTTTDDLDPHRTHDAITTARRRATDLLLTALPDEPTTSVAGWPAWRILLPHAEALLTAAEPAHDIEHTIRVLVDTAMYLQGQGQITLAITYMKRSLASSTRLHGPDHPSTLACLNNLANAYQAAGDLGRAIPLHEQSLADAVRILGEDHPNALGSRNNLAGAYEKAGDLGRAIPLREQTLTDAVRVLGEDHPNTLISRNNLATAYREAGDLGRAISLYEQTLTDRLRVFGEDHPDTLISRNNLATAYREAGDLGRAISLYEQTLTDAVRVLGEDHPFTLISRSNLASAYQEAGDLGRAIPLHEQTLVGRLRVLGEDHADTLISRNNLAGAYQAAGDLGRAIPLREQALTDAVRVLGEDHPFTLISRSNLASAYREAGDLGRAIPLHEQTLVGRLRVLGEDHPDTLISRNNLAGAFQEAGDLGRAIPLHEQSLTDAVRVLGEDHPGTLTSRDHLAGAYQAVGDLGRAIPLYVQILVGRLRVLGEDHPDTLTSRDNLAGAFEEAGDLGRAIPLYVQTLVGRLRVLGEDHPDTLGSSNNLAGAYEKAGDLGRAIPLREQTLTDAVRVLGEDHPNTLISRNNLAYAYQAVGDLGRAIPLYVQTLVGRLRVLGEDHPDTLGSRNNLASAYEKAGDLGRAVALYEQTLTDAVRVLGEDHPTTRIVRVNLTRAKSTSA